MRLLIISYQVQGFGQDEKGEGIYVPLDAKLFMFAPNDYDEKKVFEAATHNDSLGIWEDGNYQLVSKFKVEDNDEVPLYKPFTFGRYS